MIKQSDCTIIIPYFGKEKEERYALHECMKSLDETVPHMKRIISMNGGYSIASYFGLQNTDVMTSTKQGQCMAVNAAAATVNTPWIFVTNDDMIYAPGWWENLQSLGDNPLCVSPRLGEPRKGAPTFIEYFCGGAGGDFDKQKWLEFAQKNMGIHESPIRTGFNLPFLIRKDLWDTIGGYDIQFDPFSSNSDSDLEYKIRLAGIQPYQNINCLVYHFSQVSGTFLPENQSYWQTNWDYFIEKWGFPRTDEGIWEATFHMPTKKEGRIYFPEWEGKYA